MKKADVWNDICAVVLLHIAGGGKSSGTDRRGCSSHNRNLPAGWHHGSHTGNWKGCILSCSDSWRWRKLKQLLEEHRDYNSYGLTERELELVNYVLKGYSRREMAEASGLKENTVASYMKRLYRKVKVHSRKELFMK